MESLETKSGQCVILGCLSGPGSMLALELNWRCLEPSGLCLCRTSRNDSNVTMCRIHGASLLRATIVLAFGANALNL